MTNYLTEVKGSGTYGNCHVVYSKFLTRNGTAPIAVVHHPHASSADAMLDEAEFPGFRSVIDYLARHGYVVVIGDFKAAGPSGNSAQWGNDANQAGIVDAKAFGVRYGGSSSKKIFLVGFSMGALSVMSYAGRYSSAVAGVLCILPALDLVMYRTPGIYGPFAEDGVTPFPFATIDQAYGGSYNNATMGPTHNPQTMAAAGAYNAMKIDLWYGDIDTYASKALVDRFASQVFAVAPSAPLRVRKIPVKNMGHTDAAVKNTPKVEILSFAQSCVT